MEKISIQSLSAAQKFGPGHSIREQMAARAWTQQDLAAVMGITVKHVNKIVKDQQPLTVDVARLLGNAFNTSAEYWMRLDVGYRIWLKGAPSKKELDVQMKAHIFTHMPVREMLSKGWLKPYKTTEQLERQVLHFWNWSEWSVDSIEHQFLPLFQGTDLNDIHASHLFTWLKKATIEAAKTRVETYSKEKLKQVFSTIASYTLDEKGMRSFLQELTHCGVIFLYLPCFQNAQVNGALFFYEDHPVIVISSNDPSLSKFWMTVSHGLACAMMPELTAHTVLLESSVPKQHKVMQRAKSDALNALTLSEVNAYLKGQLSYLTPQKVEACAAHCQVHPSLVLSLVSSEKLVSSKLMKHFFQDARMWMPKKYQLL